MLTKLETSGRVNPLNGAYAQNIAYILEIPQFTLIRFVNVFMSI